jgi:hypothetical protein
MLPLSTVSTPDGIECAHIVRKDNEVYVLPRFSSYIHQFTVSPEGKFTPDAKIKGDSVTLIDFTIDFENDRLLTLSESSNLNIWSMEEKRIIETLPVPCKNPIKVLTVPNVKYCFIADRNCGIYNLKKNSWIFELSKMETEELLDALVVDGKICALVQNTTSGLLKLVELEDLKKSQFSAYQVPPIKGKDLKLEQIPDRGIYVEWVEGDCLIPVVSKFAWNQLVRKTSSKISADSVATIKTSEVCTYLKALLEFAGKLDLVDTDVAIDSLHERKKMFLMSNPSSDMTVSTDEEELVE